MITSSSFTGTSSSKMVCSGFIAGLSFWYHLSRYNVPLALIITWVEIGIDSALSKILLADSFGRITVINEKPVWFIFCDMLLESIRFIHLQLVFLLKLTTRPLIQK